MSEHVEPARRKWIKVLGSKAGRSIEIVAALAGIVTFGFLVWGGDQGGGGSDGVGPDPTESDGGETDGGAEFALTLRDTESAPGECEAQAIDFDDVDDGVVGFTMVPFTTHFEPHVDLTWDTCDGDWNLSTKFTDGELDAVRAEPGTDRSGCAALLGQEVGSGDWEFEPGAPGPVGDFAQDSVFCLRTSEGAMARLVVTGLLDSGSENPPEVVAEVWTP
ncbi:hypothetical protein [Glycomyces sp. NPDC048151]|uniref:hypothetical protein n=1 Tax=Glycomyces sp. NPDC048151 TaxID=3364002 RepID=UPI0037130331